jgi:hypothetical protein
MDRTLTVASLRDDRLRELGFSVNYVACPTCTTNRAANVPGTCQAVPPRRPELHGLQDMVDCVGLGGIDWCQCVTMAGRTR